MGEAKVAHKTALGYEPVVPLEVSPIFDWPPKPLASLRHLTKSMTLPYGVGFIGLAVLVWNYFTPALVRMETFGWWVLEIYLRNVVLLTIVAGGLHLVLYMRRRQDQRFKYIPRWSSKSRSFWWNNQVRDNVFWSLGSGCAFWTAFESLTFWLYAKEFIPRVEWNWTGAGVYITAMCLAVPLWSVFHFYLIHRLLHTRWLYDNAHYLHHRNVNTGPWSGISMHPLEHLIYFTLVMLYWFVPVHPVVVILGGIFQGLYPPISHSGFERVELRGDSGKTAPAGDYFHHLHHRYFECNYGNRPVPLDKFFGTLHDGTPEAHAAMKERMRARRGKAAVSAEQMETVATN